METGLHDEVGSLAERVISMFISLGGVLVTAMLLGIISDAIGEYMDGLREGKSVAHHLTLSSPRIHVCLSH